MRLLAKRLREEKLDDNEVFVLRNHNGTLIAESKDPVAFKEEQALYEYHTGNLTDVTVEQTPVAYHEEDVVHSRPLGSKPREVKESLDSIREFMDYHGIKAKSESK